MALADACALGQVPADIVLVLSDVAGAGILTEARARGIRAEHLAPGPFRTKLDEAVEREYARRLQDAGVEYVVLAGFMRILKRPFLERFAGRVVNVHPSLLPAFPGLEAWRQALEHGVKITGCTVHLVDEGIDSGPILAQAAVPVGDDDTPDRLHARIQQEEWRLLPAAIAALVRGEVRFHGRRALGVPAAGRPGESHTPGHEQDLP